MNVNEGVHGWLLHARPQGNSSLVLQLFTLEAGRVDLLAKGGRKNSLLQPFHPLWLGWAGRGNLPVLRKVEAAGAALRLTQMSLWCGYYVNELLLRLLPRAEPSALMFGCYGSTLEQLQQGGDPQPQLRAFELQLLAESGYALPLHEDSQGRPLLPNQYYRLADAGLEASSAGFVGQDLLAFAAGEWSPEVARSSRDLLRQALARQLGPVPLKSRELLQSLTISSTSP